MRKAKQMNWNWLRQKSEKFSFFPPVLCLSHSFFFFFDRFKCWEGGYRSVWVAADASGASRQIQVSPLVAAAIRQFQMSGNLEKPPLCMYFGQEGGCRFGSDCQNLHLCKFNHSECRFGKNCNFFHSK
jgi:hypothetical protein